MSGLARRWVLPCVLLAVASARAEAQVDLQAARAYLRTGTNSGSEVTSPGLGQQVIVHVDYLVVGGTAPFNAVVRAIIDGTEHCSGSLQFEPDSDRVIWCPEAYVATAGTHTLRWELDTQNAVTEISESNNAVELTFTTSTTASRDLEALRAYLRTQPNGGVEVVNPMLGQQVYFHVEHRTGGTGAAFMAMAAATLDGQAYCSGPITFTPGVDGVVWCPAAWTATAGTHTLRWEVDSARAITETDENNNTAQVTFTTGATAPTDIEAERAYLRTLPDGGIEVGEADVGAQLYVHLDYAVTGTNEEFLASVRATIDDVEICAGAVTFDPEAGTVWCEQAWTAVAGTHTLRWTVDSAEIINESDEENNTATKIFTIGGPALCVGDCDDNGTVVVNELVTGVNIALDRGDIDDCRLFDRDGSGTVVVSELVTGVDNLLRGCP